MTTALYRMKIGNFSNVESVGEGVFEYKIHFGAGYRIYFGQSDAKLVLLLGGGTKKQQHHDIKIAKELWREYKHLKTKRAGSWH